MSSTLSILNVGTGDTKLSFDPKNPAERIRAARIVTDMLRRGYALLVDTGEKDAKGEIIYTRVKEFDEAKCEYIIADFDPLQAVEADTKEQQNAEVKTPEKETQRFTPAPRRGRPRKSLPAASTNAVAIAPSAGG